MKTSKRLIRAAAFTAVTTATSVASADDCAWARETLERYLATCQTYDGCANKAMMHQSAAATCGGAMAPITPPSSVAGARPGGGGSMRPTGRSGRSAGAASGGAGGGIGNIPMPDPWKNPAPPPEEPAYEDYTGRSCAYFTRPSVESEGGVTRTNYYADGSTVCYQTRMYRCENSRWASRGSCDTWQGWEDVRAEVLER